MTGGELHAQEVPEQISGQPSQKTHRYLQATKSDRGIEHRSACMGYEGLLTVRHGAWQHVDESLAAT